MTGILFGQAKSSKGVNSSVMLIPRPRNTKFHRTPETQIVQNSRRRHQRLWYTITTFQSVSFTFVVLDKTFTTHIVLTSIHLRERAKKLLRGRGFVVKLTRETIVL
jgi:hypothetical protein